MPTSPSSVFAITRSAGPAQTSPSGTTSVTRNVTASPLQVLGLALDVLDPAAHEERLLGHVVVFALGDRLEGRDSLLERHERALDARELLGHVHRVGQEALDPPGALHRDLVFF